MKTPKKNTSRKSAPAAKKNSVRDASKPISNPGLLSEEEDDDFDLPMNEVDLDGLESFDDDDDDF
jgi:hypothetical protein